MLIKSIDLVLVALGTGGFCIYELILSSNPSAIDRLFKQIRQDEVNYWPAGQKFWPSKAFVLWECKNFALRELIDK